MHQFTINCRDATSSLRECIFALDLLDMSLPNPRSFKAFIDVFLGVSAQHRLKKMPDDKREVAALQTFRRAARYHRPKPQRWSCPFAHNVVTHIHDTSLPQLTLLNRTDEDAALRLQAIETLEVSRIMLQQLHNLGRSDWRFLLLVRGVNFSSAVLRERPLQEGIWKMLFAGALLKRGRPKAAADYVASAMAIMDKFDRLQRTNSSTDAEAAKDLNSDDSANINTKTGTEAAPPHIVAEKLLLQHSYTMYLFTVGSWGICEKVSQQLHEGYENIGLSSTPSARLNLTVLAYTLFVQGKHWAWIDALRLNHSLFAEVDAGYHWGRHLACDLAAGLVVTGVDGEAESWYTDAKEQQSAGAEVSHVVNSHGLLSY